MGLMRLFQHQDMLKIIFDPRFPGFYCTLIALDFGQESVRKINRLYTL